MVKVGVFADTHVGRSIPNAVAEQRRQAFRHAFMKAIDTFIEENVELVIHAGDLFERRSMTAPDSLFVKNELQRLVDSLGGNVKIVIVRGNHDGTAENSAINYIEHPLAKYLTVLGDGTLNSKPEAYLDGGIAVVGFGYTPYAAARLAEVKEVVREKFSGIEANAKIFLIHAFVEGQEVPPNVPLHQVVGLNLLNDLGADLVIAGHHHKYMELAEKSGVRLLTPGATESIDLSDDSEHGVCILTLDRQVNCKFKPIKPLYRIKNEVIDSREATWRPESYVERAVEAAGCFIGELGGEQGMLRIALRGFLDGNKFDLEAEVEGRLRGILAENANLLHVEIDNGVSEVSQARISVPEHMGREEFLREVFSCLGGERMAQALSLAEEVYMTLEEKASPQTGLLKESDRKTFVERWLKILEAE